MARIEVETERHLGSPISWVKYGNEELQVSRDPNHRSRYEVLVPNSNGTFHTVCIPLAKGFVPPRIVARAPSYRVALAAAKRMIRSGEHKTVRQHPVTYGAGN